MNNQRQTPKSSCTVYNRQISRIIDGRAGLRDYPELEKHIKTCPDCAAMLNLVISLDNGLGRDLHSLPAPPRSVLHNTLKYMEIKKSTNSAKESLWDYISSLLQYRIPVYQAVGVMIVILFVSGFLWNTRTLTGNDGPYQLTEKTAMEDVYALDSLHAGGNERGQNAREDSILVGFLQVSL